jgi:hypothetical protein
MRRSSIGVVVGAMGAAAVVVVAAALAAALLAVAGCGSATSQTTAPSPSASVAAAGVFSDPAHDFSLKYDEKSLIAALPASAPWIAQFDKALGSGGKTTFVVAFHLPGQSTAGSAAGQLPIPVQAVGVTLSNLSADGYTQFVTPTTFRAYAKQVHAQNRRFYGPSTQTQITKVGGYPAISSASYGKDKAGQGQLVWSVTVFTPKWNYLFYTVADATNARQFFPAFDAVLRSLHVTK